MRPPEEYAESRRGWGLAALGTYGVAMSAFALSGVVRGYFGALFLLGLVAVIACLVATGVFLIRWMQRDVADGRFAARPGRSALLRFAPGLGMIIAMALPWDASRGFLFISGLNYAALAVIAELSGSMWTRWVGIAPPPMARVSLTVPFGVYTAIFGFIGFALVPTMAVAFGVAVIELVPSGFALWVLWRGRTPGSSRIARLEVPRALTPRERLALATAAGLNLFVAALVLWFALAPR